MYSIIYVMPKGSRVGMYASVTEQELLKEIENLQSKGCRIEEVRRDDESMMTKLVEYISA